MRTECWEIRETNKLKQFQTSFEIIFKENSFISLSSKFRLQYRV